MDAELISQSIVLISGGAAIFAALLAVIFRRTYRWVLLLLAPMAILIAKYAPEFFRVSKAGREGFATFYIRLYEDFTDEQKLSVIIFPIIFIVAYLTFRILRNIFHVEKTESTQSMKDRVKAYYGIIDS